MTDEEQWGFVFWRDGGGQKNRKFDFSGIFFPLKVNRTLGNHAAKKDPFAWEVKRKIRLDAQKG